MVPNTTNEAYEARDVSSRAPLVNVFFFFFIVLIIILT